MTSSSPDAHLTSSKSASSLMTVVGGGYEYDDGAPPLGEGGYSLVYGGRDRRSGRPIAIKRVPIDRVKIEELQSMRMAAGEHLVRLLDYLVTASYAYIVMEWCDTDLGRHLKNNNNNSTVNNGKLTEVNFRYQDLIE